MEVDSCVPPGFRFHPTEEELVGYYLTRKVAALKIDLDVIKDIDLYRIEPWDLRDRCKHGYEEQTEWYFFSHKDKKYPSGTRTNRATAAGFWKATGRDKAILAKSKIIGMRKTLVFYQGRAPNGRKSDWIMHEYRLQTSEHGPPQEEGWVVCKAFRKQVPNQRPYCNTFITPTYCTRDHSNFISDDIYRSNRFLTNTSFSGANFHQDQQQQLGFTGDLNYMTDIPHLDSPSLSTSLAPNESLKSECNSNRNINEFGGQFLDWKVLDKLLASQLTESASCSNTITDTAAALNCEAADQNHEDHFFASFHT